MADIDGTNFLSGANAEFIAGMYQRYLDDPDGVDASWRRFFSGIGDDAAALSTERGGPSWAPAPQPVFVERRAAALATASTAEAVRDAAADSIRALNLVRAYRVRGHLEADLDPLGLEQRAHIPELDYRTYGFTEADLDREIFINNLLGRGRTTLRDLIALLRRIYCGRIGVEYMHIQVLAERQWMQQKFEHPETRPTLTNAAKKEVLRVLTV